MELRRATAEASVQFGRILVGFAGERDELSVVRGGLIVEAFPNVFLGVLMSEEELTSGPKLKRGRRFDWLYDQVVTTGRLGSMLSRPPVFCAAVILQLQRTTILINEKPSLSVWGICLQFRDKHY